MRFPFLNICGRVMGIILGGIIGALLLWYVHFLPTDRMQMHIYQSLPLLQKEFENSIVIEGYEATLTGSFTDCLMLENAIYYNEAHSAFEQALMMYRGEVSEGDGWAPGTSLAAYLEDAPMSREISYSRYWHGYLLILKPLLMLTNVQTLRICNAIVQSIMMCMLVGLCFRQKKGSLGVILAAALMFIYPFVLYFSFSLSICYYLVLAAVMTQVLWREKWKSQKSFCIFFMVVGMGTAYFDFLTYPLVTLGFPLGIEIYCSEKRWTKKCGEMLQYLFHWFAGYIGMWAMKWVISDVVFGAGTIKDALTAIGERTQSAVEQSVWQGYAQVLEKNLSYYINIPFLFIVMGIVLWQIAGLGKEWCSGDEKKRGYLLGVLMNQAIPCMLLALLPFIWYIVTQNHSMEHSVYTCKIVSITVFAVFIFISGWKAGFEENNMGKSAKE